MRGYRRLRLPDWLRWAILLMACGYLAIRLVDLVLLAPLAVLAETEARVRGVEAVNQIILGSVSQHLQHDDLISYEKDHQGRIAAYRVNTQAVNQVAAEAAAAVQREFRALAAQPFGLPIGALSGSQILSTRGPRLPVRIMPVGSAMIDVRQEFQGEGINQTRHRVWLKAEAQVQVILPLVSRAVTVTVEVPITETVIVGPVPESFFGSGTGTLAVPTRP